jgi:sulfur-oxidizing protein SoxX
MIYRTILGAVSGAVVAGALTFGANAAEITIVDGTIPASLTGTAGDPANGKKVAIDRKKGNCLACHAMPIPEEQFHGDIGPDLGDVGANLSDATLRLRLVDSKAINPDTIMPAFLMTGKTRVLKKFEGKTILTPQEVEDVIAYLLTLKGQLPQ